MNYLLEHPEFIWTVVTGLLCFSFGCGITYFTIKETRRNVNGLGYKVTKLKDWMVANEPDENKRIKLLEYLK